MGRFYKSSKGNYLDFIYKQPTNLLLKAQQAADQSLAQQEQAYGDLYGRLQINALNADDERAKSILQGYEQRIEDKAVDLRNDPLKYINNPAEFRKLSNEIYKDKTRGQWAAIEANTAARSTFAKKLDTQVDAGKITRDEADQLLGLADVRFAKDYGTFGKKGDAAINSWKGNMISDYVDVYDEIDKLLTNIKPNSFESQGIKIGTVPGADGNNKYKITYLKSGEEVEADRVESLVKNVIFGDPKIKSYFDTRQIAGIRGFSPEEISNEEGTGYKNRLANFALNKFVYKKTKNKKDIKGADDFDLSKKEGKIKSYYSTQTGYINTVGPNNPAVPGQFGTYDAVHSNLANVIEKVNYVKKLTSAGGDVSNLVSEYDRDVLSEAMEDGIMTGNFENARRILEDNNVTIPSDLDQFMKTYDENSASDFKLNMSKSIQGLYRLEEDYDALQSIMSEYGITDITNINQPKIKEAIDNQQNSSLKALYTSIINGKIPAQELAFMERPGDFKTRIFSIREAIGNTKDYRTNTAPDYTTLDAQRNNDLLYDEALDIANIYLGSNAGIYNQSANIITERGTAEGIPNWLVGVSNLDKNNIRKVIAGKTHTNNKLDKNKFNIFWSNLDKDFFQLEMDKNGFSSMFKPSSGNLDALTEQEIIKAMVATVDPFSEEQTTEAKAVKVVDLKGKAADISVSPMETAMVNINNKMVSSYIQKVKFTDSNGNSQEVQLVSKIPDTENFGVIGSNSQRQEKEENARANNIASRTFKETKQQGSNFGYFAYDIAVPEQTMTVDGREERIKLISINNPKTSKAEIYIVPATFESHIKERNVDNILEAVKGHHLRYSGNPAPYTEKTKDAAIGAISNFLKQD
tara:strand:+ start:16810 stop:19395 length:2586 start_codon:yes stop_codon:yes gene_type:complete